MAAAAGVLVACVIVSPAAAVPTALLFVTTIVAAFRGKAIEKNDS